MGVGRTSGTGPGNTLDEGGRRRSRREGSRGNVVGTGGAEEGGDESWGKEVFVKVQRVGATTQPTEKGDTGVSLRVGRGGSKGSTRN